MTSNSILRIPVLKVSQPIGDFFIASMPAQELVAITYKDVRRMVDEQRDVEKYLGIQRPILTRRINEIKRYIEGSDATFPTAVIVSVDERCAEFEQTEGNAGFLTLQAYTGEDGSGDEAISYDRIAKVLDGQHRLAAFVNDKDTWEFDFDGEPFDINVSIFVGADISEQANIFATVNLAQTKVNKSLVYDLTALAKTRSPYKTCHNVAVALDGNDKSPLHKRIKRLGTATPGRKYEPITQAAFVESLIKFISVDPVKDRNMMLEGKTIEEASLKQLSQTPFRNLFVEGQDLLIAEIVYNYFSAVRKKWPSSWDAVSETGNLLPKSNAFKALMKFLLEKAYPNIVGNNFGTIPTIDDFYGCFDHLA